MLAFRDWNAGSILFPSCSIRTNSNCAALWLPLTSFSNNSSLFSEAFIVINPSQILQFFFLHLIKFEIFGIFPPPPANRFFENPYFCSDQKTNILGIFLEFFYAGKNYVPFKFRKKNFLPPPLKFPFWTMEGEESKD